MIQRLQSLYLLAAALVTGLFLAYAGSWWGIIAGIYGWSPIVVAVLAVAVTLLALGAVFMYGDREKQHKVVDITIWLDLLLVLMIVIVILSANMRADVILDQADVRTIYMYAFFPIAGYIFLRLAKRGIQKDIATVRSMDRLR